MNYAAVFLAFILGCAAIFWYVSGKQYYSGPVIEAQAEDTDSNLNNYSRPSPPYRHKEKDEIMV